MKLAIKCYIGLNARLKNFRIRIFTFSPWTPPTYKKIKVEKSKLVCS